MSQGEWKPSRKINSVCCQCKKEFISYQSQKRKFCSRTCLKEFKSGEEKDVPLNTDLAYVLGVLCGDGWISQKKDKPTDCYLSLESIDKEFVEVFQKACTNIFKREFPIRLKTKELGWGTTPRYFVRIYGKNRIGKILSFCNFGCYSWVVPKEIEKSSNENKCLFLKGFFDSEGTILHHNIVATSVNKLGLLEVKELLQSIKIDSKFYEIKERIIRDKKIKSFILSIQTRKSIKTFMEIVGFTISRKNKKLKEMLEFNADRISEHHKIIPYDLREKSNITNTEVNLV